MSVLLAKIVLAPLFVVGTSLLARRYGVRVGGLVGGLPVVAGPILLVFALLHGSAFTAQAASATLLGLVSLTTFIVVYGRVATRLPWVASLLAGWAAFAAATAALATLRVPSGLAAVLACAGFALALRLLPRPASGSPSRVCTPAWDLPLRAASALALVLTLTAVAGRLGPHLSGLLAPFPVIASVLATFTHAQRGHDDLLALLHGLVVGLLAYALFCFTLAVSLRGLDLAPAFGVATAAALLAQSAVLYLNNRGGPVLRAAPAAHRQE